MMLKSTLPFLLLVSVYSFRQCDNKFPDGSICDEFAEEITQADPENCWKFYRCHGGCVTHEMCQLNYKYDDRYAWCTYPWDVECGDRPCFDPQHCPGCATTFPDGSTCDGDANDETQADPDNCWKFYKCHGYANCVTHETCDNDYKFDDRYHRCTHPEYVVCGDRPCDDPQHCPCATTFPDGSTCDEDTEDETKADTDHCWKFFKCHGGCVTLETCHMDEVYDDRYNWCTYPEYVDCGDRPCDNSYYCP